MTEPRRRGTLRQWSRGRTLFFLVVTFAAAVLAGFIAGYLALAVVIVVGLLTVSYFGTDRFGNWRTGRPSRARRQLAESRLLPPGRAAQLGADPDAVESWLRERSLDGFIEDRGDD